MLPRAVMTGFCLLVFTGGQPAIAESYKFTLYNHSQYEISGFQTYENGKWDDWKNVSVSSDDHQVMDWNSNEGNCVVPFRIIYADVETEQYKIDWCNEHLSLMTSEVSTPTIREQAQIVCVPILKPYTLDNNGAHSYPNIFAIICKENHWDSGCGSDGDSAKVNNGVRVISNRDHAVARGLSDVDKIKMLLFEGLCAILLLFISFKN